MQNVNSEINDNIINKTTDKQVWKSLGFDELQIMEIVKGIENGIDVTLYCCTDEVFKIRDRGRHRCQCICAAGI